MRPSKDEAMKRFRWFANEALESARIAIRDGATQQVAEDIEQVAYRATYYAERLNISGHDYVPPETANQFKDLADSMAKIAGTVNDPALTMTLRAPSLAIDAFLSKYYPTQTESGRFIFPLDE